MCIHTYSHYVFHRFNNASGKKVTEGVRVMRLLAWLWENFPIPFALRIEYLPGDLNVYAYVLSRWYHHRKQESVLIVASGQWFQANMDYIGYYYYMSCILQDIGRESNYCGYVNKKAGRCLCLISRIW